jgi:hypothetical protein
MEIKKVIATRTAKPTMTATAIATDYWTDSARPKEKATGMLRGLQMVK